MIDVADGLGMPLRTKAGNFIEGQFWTRCDHQKVVINMTSIGEFHPIFGRLELGHLVLNKLDLFLFEDRCQFDRTRVMK